MILITFSHLHWSTLCTEAGKAHNIREVNRGRVVGLGSYSLGHLHLQSNRLGQHLVQESVRPTIHSGWCCIAAYLQMAHTEAKLKCIITKFLDSNNTTNIRVYWTNVQNTIQDRHKSEVYLIEKKNQSKMISQNFHWCQFCCRK